jgi:hypothetical protein
MTFARHRIRTERDNTIFSHGWRIPALFFNAHRNEIELHLYTAVLRLKMDFCSDNNYNVLPCFECHSAIRISRCCPSWCVLTPLILKYNAHICPSSIGGGGNSVAFSDVETYEQKYSGKWLPTQLTGAQTPGIYTLRPTPAYTKVKQFQVELLKPVLLHRLPSSVHLIFLRNPRLLVRHCVR